MKGGNEIEIHFPRKNGGGRRRIHCDPPLLCTPVYQRRDVWASWSLSPLALPLPLPPSRPLASILPCTLLWRDRYVIFSPYVGSSMFPIFHLPSERATKREERVEFQECQVISGKEYRNTFPVSRRPS